MMISWDDYLVEYLDEYCRITGTSIGDEHWGRAGDGSQKYDSCPLKGGYDLGNLERRLLVVGRSHNDTDQPVVV